ANIIVTAGTEEKRALCTSLGAEVAIDYKEGPFAENVLEEKDGKRVNLILDVIIAEYWQQNIDSLALDGELSHDGIIGGSTLENVDLGKILFKRVQVIGTALRVQPMEKKIALTKEFASYSLLKFADGSLKPIIDSVWDWQEVNDAHQHMEANKNAGKIVLRVNG